MPQPWFQSCHLLPGPNDFLLGSLLLPSPDSIFPSFLPESVIFLKIDSRVSYFLKIPNCFPQWSLATPSTAPAVTTLNPVFPEHVHSLFNSMPAQKHCSLCPGLPCHTSPPGGPPPALPGSAPGVPLLGHTSFLILSTVCTLHVTLCSIYHTALWFYIFLVPAFLTEKIPYPFIFGIQ